MTSSSVDVASSATRLNKLSVMDDRAKPVSSHAAYAHVAVIDTAGAAAKAKNDASVYSAYIHLSSKYFTGISAVPFRASFSKTDGAQHLFRSTNLVTNDTLMRCDDLSTDDLLETGWVPG